MTQSKNLSYKKSRGEDISMLNQIFHTNTCHKITNVLDHVYKIISSKDIYYCEWENKGINPHYMVTVI